MNLFDCLPVACAVNGIYLCMHGGISPELDEVDDINNKVERFQEPPNVGLMCDLLWSDPLYDNQEALSSDFTRNEERDCSYKFGMAPAKQLLRSAKMLTIVRAHEV